MRWVDLFLCKSIYQAWKAFKTKQIFCHLNDKVLSAFDKNCRNYILVFREDAAKNGNIILYQNNVFSSPIGFPD